MCKRFGLTDGVFSSTKELGFILQSNNLNMATVTQETMDGDIDEANHLVNVMENLDTLRLCVGQLEDEKVRERQEKSKDQGG